MEEFILLKKSQSFYKYMRRHVLSIIPKIHSVYRLKLDDYLILLNENIIRANINNMSDRTRSKYQKEALINISMIELLVRIIKEEDIIDGKRFMTILRQLNEIKKMLFGWMNEEDRKVLL